MEEKLRILHIVTTGSKNNGILTYVLAGMEASRTAVSFDIVVLVRPEEWIASRMEALGSRIYVLPCRNRNPLKYVFELEKIIRNGKYDIVHAHGNSCTLYTEMAAAKKAGAAVRIAHAHNSSCRMKTLHRLLRRPFDRSYTHAAACGEMAGEFLFAGRPFTVLKNGIDCRSFAFDEKIRERKRNELDLEGKRVFLHVGNFNGVKNQEFLLKPFQSAYEEDRNMVLLFAGGGERMAETQKAADELGLTEKEVRFLGRRDDVKELLNAADVFVLPSLYEGFPVSLVEAQTSGLPCLVSETVTADSAILDDVSFLPLHEEEWTSAFRKTVPKEYRGDACSKMIGKGYDGKDASAGLLEYYKKAAEGKKLRKLFIVTRNMAGGGCERVIAQIANTLSDEGVECKILTQYAHRSFYPLGEKVQLETLLDRNSCSGKDIPKIFLKLRRIVKKEKPDVVLAMPDMVNVWSGIFLRGTRIPLVVSERNDPARFPENSWKRKLRNPAYKNVNGFVFQTAQQRAYFPEEIQKRSIVLDNPMDCSAFPLREQDCTEKTVVSVGRLSAQKNHELLLKAFGLFHKDHSDWKLIVYGEGCERARLEELGKSIAEGSVLFPGEVHDVPYRIRNAGMFVLSSNYEGMPNALMEAMALGIPCISTNCPIGGPESLILDGENGILVPPADEKAMADAMERIAEDTGFANRIGKKAAEIRERLEVRRVVGRWKDYLESFLVKQ